MSKAEIKVRLSSEEKKLWEGAATAAGHPLQQFIRRTVNTTLDRQDLTIKYDKERAEVYQTRARKARAARDANAAARKAAKAADGTYPAAAGKAARKRASRSRKAKK